MVNGDVFVIVDYGMGNLRSVANALRFLGCKTVITNNQKDIVNSQAIILPGVGAFGEAMNNLNQLGLVDLLRQQALIEKKPLLGICLGMQLLADSSQENGCYQGLGIIKGDVIKIPLKSSLRLPHIGWNDIEIIKQHPLFDNIQDEKNFYFVHSYFLNCDEAYISSYCFYGSWITASIQKENIFATQFHPEKSQGNGLRVLRAFSDFARRHNHTLREGVNA